MIGATVKIEDKTKQVATAMDRAAFRSNAHAAAGIRKDAVQSITVSSEPSPAGTPPHTRKRQLNRSIRFYVDKQKKEAIVGPRASMVGNAGAIHEHGEMFMGEQFEARPFMRPALNRNLDRLIDLYRGSMGI